MFGSANPQHDFPKLLDLYRGGKLDLEGMVSKTYTLDQAPKAFEDLEKGSNARGVIVFDALDRPCCKAGPAGPA